MLWLIDVWPHLLPEDHEKLLKLGPHYSNGLVDVFELMGAIRIIMGAITDPDAQRQLTEKFAAIHKQQTAPGEAA